MVVEGTKERSAEGRGPKSVGMRNGRSVGESQRDSRGGGPGRRMGGSGGNGVENAERIKPGERRERRTREMKRDRWKKKREMRK